MYLSRVEEQMSIPDPPQFSEQTEMLLAGSAGSSPSISSEQTPDPAVAVSWGSRVLRSEVIPQTCPGGSNYARATVSGCFWTETQPVKANLLVSVRKGQENALTQLRQLHLRENFWRANIPWIIQYSQDIPCVSSRFLNRLKVFSQWKGFALIIHVFFITCLGWDTNYCKSAAVKSQLCLPVFAAQNVFRRVSLTYRLTTEINEQLT